MGSSVPSWLDRSFFTKVLQSVEETEKDVEVMKFQCKSAVAPGNNYLSQLYRLSVEYKVHQTDRDKFISLIIKIPLTYGRMKEMLEKSNGFENELKTYNEILPKMYELCNLRVTPKSFYCPMKNSLVLEDLNASGYKMADRLAQLDFPHCQHTLVALARLHALSVAVLQSNPQLKLSAGVHWVYNDQAPEKDLQQKRNFNKRLLRGVLGTIKQLEGCEKYFQLISSKISDNWKEMVKLVKPREGLNVLIHGDVWTVNVLFKYNEAGKVIDAKFVDFQMLQYSSYTIDIIFFLWTSANEEVREHHREQLFEVYRQTLNNTLRELNCTESLSKEDFDRDMKASAPFSLNTVASVLAAAMADSENLTDYNEFIPTDSDTEDLNDDSPLLSNYRSKYYKAVLPNILRQIEEFGAFD